MEPQSPSEIAKITYLVTLKIDGQRSEWEDPSGGAVPNKKDPITGDEFSYALKEYAPGDELTAPDDDTDLGTKATITTGKK